MSGNQKTGGNSQSNMVTGLTPTVVNGSPSYPQTGIVGTVSIPPRPTTVAVPSPTMLRAPLDMNSLLRACTELGQSGDGITQTSEEDKVFLEKAIFQDFQNTADEMKIALSCLQDVHVVDGREGEHKEDHLNSLDILIDYVDDIDTANDCIKRGGLYTCFDCFKSPFPEIRAAGCTLMAELVQNNQKCYQECQKSQVLRRIIKKFEADGEVPMVQEKALYAVSCLLRDNPEATKTFLTEWGFNWLFGLILKSGNINILKKCRYILHSILHCEEEGVSVTKAFYNPGDTIEFCNQLIARLRKSTCVPSRNIILHMILSIFSAQNDLHEEFSSQEFGLVHIVKEYLA